jgi:hypothetical protein
MSNIARPEGCWPTSGTRRNAVSFHRTFSIVIVVRRRQSTPASLRWVLGFNMSWIFVDGIDQDALYEALDLTPTGGTPDPHDLGTSRVPLAGATLTYGWCGVFAKYALVMDATMGTNPPRLTRLPAKSQSITCVVLEHAMVSYASLWQDGRYAWQIRHDSSQGTEHLEAFGDLPAGFAEFRDRAMREQRAERKRRKQGEWGVDYVFDVPVDAAAKITGYRHDRASRHDLVRNVQSLVPINGNALTKLSQPPKWWQTLGSTKYE